MTHVVTDNCIHCKYTDCVEVCPIPGCFHEAARWLVIHPDKCIDCGVCVPACPAKAIKADTDEGAAPWVQRNREWALKTPPLFEKKAPLPEADAWLDVPNKFNTL